MGKVLIYAILEGKGGIEEYVLNLSRFCDNPSSKYGYIVLGEKTAYKDEFEKMNIDCFFIPPKNQIFKNIKSLHNLFSIQRNLYDTIYFNTSGLYYIVPFCLAKKYKYKIILHSHSSGGGWPKRIIHYLNRIWISKIVNNKLACSQKAGKWMFGNKKFEIIPNAIDIERFQYNEQYRNYYRDKYSIKEKFVLGNIGRLHPGKNQCFIVDILSCLVNNGVDAVLLLVGDGEMKDEIQKKVNDLNLKDRVFFAGQTDHPEYFYSVMDFFVMPSFIEGFPITLVEAQANGLPCIVSDTITQETNISNEICYMSIYDSPQTWAEYIQKNNERYNCKDILIRKGFEIRNQCKKIESIL